MANPFVHVELNTTDVEKAKGFYTKLFSWKLEDMPMPTGSYTMINVGEGTGGGMMKHPMPGAPSRGCRMCWSTTSGNRLRRPSRSARR
jgi:predicted enzyme related to lactoylglutathione lyase